MKLRELPPRLLFLTLTMIIANLASNMYFPLLPLYLESLGATVREVGFFFTMQVILSIAFRILGGWISDNIGRLLTVALGSSVGMAAILSFTLAPTWELAILGALFGEMGASLVGPSFQAYTAENAPEGKMSSTFGIVHSLFFVCMIIGPLLGGFLAENYGYKPMLWVATGIFLIATATRIALAWGSKIEIKPLHVTVLVREVRSLVMLFLAGGLLLWLFVIDGVMDAGWQVAYPFIPKYVTEMGKMSESHYGALFALMAVVATLTMWPGGMFADKFGERWSLTLGTAIFALMWGLMVVAPRREVFILCFVLAGAGRAFIDPAFSALISKAVPKESLGLTWGVFLTALGILAIPAPYIGGLLYEKLGAEVPFLAALVLAIAVIPVILSRLPVMERLKKEEEPRRETVPSKV